LLVFSLNDKKTFKQLEYWAKEVKDNVSPEAFIFIIGTKLDLN
jgi:GTPase SAR1 family protein